MAFKTGNEDKKLVLQTQWDEGLGGGVLGSGTGASAGRSLPLWGFASFTDI